MQSTRKIVVVDTARRPVAGTMAEKDVIEKTDRQEETPDAQTAAKETGKAGMLEQVAQGMVAVDLTTIASAAPDVLEKAGEALHPL